MSRFNRGQQGGGGVRRPDSGGAGAAHSRGFPSPRAGSSPDESVEQHWSDYLKGGYFDADGKLKVEYVSRDTVEPLVKTMCESRSGLTSHQVRRYFGHCRALETRLRATGATWPSVWPQVKKLDIAAADGAAKQPPKIPALFHDFIKRNIAAIKTQKDFLEGFLPHFEALVGFATRHFRRERN